MSIGSNDARIWQNIAWNVQAHGLIGAYQADPVAMNHPIPPVLWAWFAVTAVSPYGFYFVMRLPGIAADLWTVRLLTKQGPPRIWAMALNPVAILISGYHGNTDSVYACLSLWSALQLSQRRYFSGGLALAAAINIKLIPILLIPPALSTCRRWTDARKLLMGLAVGVIPFLPLLLHPAVVRHNMLGYSPTPNRWGVVFLLEQLSAQTILRAWAKAAMEHYSAIGKIITISSVLLASVYAGWRRRWTAPQRYLLVYAIFLIVTGGFGVQYLVMMLPLLIAVDVRAAWQYSCSGGVFLLLVYGLTQVGLHRWESWINDLYPMAAALFGWLAYWTLIQTVNQLCRSFDSDSQDDFRPFPPAAHAARS